MIRRRFFALVVLALLIFASPALALADDEPSTPDPGYGGVPLCQSPADTDCVPDPGPRPETPPPTVTVTDGEWDCANEVISVTTVTETPRWYVGPDNTWHPHISVDVQTGTRLMTEDELAACELAVAPTEVPPTAEPSPPTIPDGTDATGPTPTIADEAPSQGSGVHVTVLPSTGSGDAAHSERSDFLVVTMALIIAIAALAIKWSTRRRRRR